MKKKIDILKLVISILILLIVGFGSSVLTKPNIDSWYLNLIKPVFNPSNWIFAPVWTILFILIGLAFYLVWTSPAKNKTRAYTLFGFQLFLNFSWSLIFFCLHSLLLAFVEIIVLWVSIVLMMIYFRKISNLSFYLLIPYILWVSFALVLNWCIYILN